MPVIIAQHFFHITSIFLLIMTMLGTNAVAAKWQLEETNDGNWISMKTKAGHQLIVSEYAGETLFTLILEVPQNAPSVPLEAMLVTDENEILITRLKLLQKLPYAMAFRIMLANHEKQLFVEQMIAGMRLEITFGEFKEIIHSLNFSLIGYTDAYTDLLIVNEIGSLDHEKLIEKNKQKEFDCYSKAKIFTQALHGRMAGKSFNQVKEELSKIDFVGVTKIIFSAYRLPYNEFPVHSSAKKYTIFKDCMSSS